VNHPVDGLLWYVAFLFSTTLHEASHALAAWRLGDSTAYEGGQVTLNPIPHMKREPIGTIVVPIISFLLGGWMIGWASVPYNFQWALNNPRRAAKMSLAGPAANLLLVMLTSVAIRLGMAIDVFVPPETVDFTRVVAAAHEGVFSTVAAFLNVFFSLNLLLLLFNLLPVPPLDGSGAVPLFLSEERSKKYLEFIRNPSLSFAGILVAWKVFDVIYAPLHLACVNLLYYAAAHYG
jgi:Zn-dependent protease